MSQIIKNVFTLCIAPKFVQLIFELRYLVADGLRSKILRQSCMSWLEPSQIQLWILKMSSLPPPPSSLI